MDSTLQFALIRPRRTGNAWAMARSIDNHPGSKFRVLVSDVNKEAERLMNAIESPIAIVKNYKDKYLTVIKL